MWRARVPARRKFWVWIADINKRFFRSALGSEKKDRGDAIPPNVGSG